VLDRRVVVSVRADGDPPSFVMGLARNVINWSSTPAGCRQGEYEHEC
jgi:hypothetical protein